MDDPDREMRKILLLSRGSNWHQVDEKGGAGGEIPLLIVIK